VTTALIVVNWFGFIFAVVTGNTLEASLGYYINPLVSVALGMIFLHERLRAMQWIAIVLAAIAVSYLTISYGTPPWLALMLAFSFGFYGLLRKQAHVDATLGLSVEMTLLYPFMTGLIIWFVATEQSAIGLVNSWRHVLIFTTGIVTVLPLLWFTNAARRLRLSTLGFLQYIAPTGQFLIAVLLFDEAFTPARAISFALIWIALTIFSIDSARAHRSERRRQAAGPARA
jgi:chloramphenicol-sensitive protein RarD